MAERRYRAFISYSHRDKRIAGWLHRALETYRLPPHLLEDGSDTRLHPIFKDREELPAADSLGDAIESAIRASDALIVLCSPDAARSPWIAREIDSYKRLNGDRNVFPVIVEGDPPDNFPAPLLVRYENGAPTQEAAEPIAADLRKTGDGRKLGKLKLVAGLSGIDLDNLVQRDAARRQRRLAYVAGLLLVGMIGTSALALYAIDQRNEARAQRAEADGLIEYMLTDLREQLEPVGRLDLLDGVGTRAMDYYARQKLADLSDTELGRRARATMLVAEVQNLRGNNEDALPAFEQAARTTEALLERDPDDPERMYNHGQSLFWVGYIAWQHGKMGEAQAAMQAYADVSARLAAMDRDNVDWQMEEAYSLSNLGTMELEAGRNRRALEYFERGLAAIEAIEARAEEPDSQAFDRAGALSWISTTLAKMGRIEEAIAVRERERAVYAKVLAADPSNNEIRRTSVYASGSLGQLLLLVGQREKAEKLLDEAISEGLLQAGSDPDNTLPRELVLRSLHDRALMHAARGRVAEARQDALRYSSILQELVRRDPSNDEWAIVGMVGADLLLAIIDMPAARPETQLRTARKALARLDRKKPDNLQAIATAHLLAGYAYQKTGERQKAMKEFRLAGEVTSRGDAYLYRLQALRALGAEHSGNRALARQIRADLATRGIDPTIDDAIERSARR